MKADNIVIDKAVFADINGIMEIERASFSSEAFSRRQMIYLMRQAKGIFLVAKSADRVVGYISFITNERYNNGRIYSIVTASDYRGCGIAGLLIDKSIEYAELHKLHAIFLEVHTDNQPAISLYQKKGFVKRSIKLKYYGDGGDAFSMVLELNPMEN